jgi:hypothetical protein
MSFSPVLPLGGVAGWSLLQRVEAGQREAFERRPDVARLASAFEARIGEIGSAAELVADRRLLQVALGAFGLDEEIDKRAFVRRALESDPADPRSFANRLVDARYRRFAAAFGFGALGGPETGRPGFGKEIADAFRERAFEIAVGESDPSLRLALNARRELAAYAAGRDPEGAGWFSLLGDRPVRRVVETALGLPPSFGQLDVDRQRDELRARVRAEFGQGSLAVFSDPGAVEEIIRRFLVRETAAAGPSASAPGATALQLLGGGLGPGGARNLLLSLAAS